MNIRTDLALERKETKTGTIEGVESTLENHGEITVTRIKVKDDIGAKSLNKPIGEYVTVEIPPIDRHGGAYEDTAQIISKELCSLLGDISGTVLVVGIGNTAITPDALGPKTALGILATRHISHELCEQIGLPYLKSVAVLSPGVLGQTGMELQEIVKGAVENVKPCAVIAVDALTARKVSRLGRTVQLSNTGISPGSGVNNARKELSKATLGVPVVAVGIPTVVDAATLIYDFCGYTSDTDSENMIVTPKEIDLMIDRAAELLSFSINSCLQPDTDPEIIRALV